MRAAIYEVHVKGHLGKQWEYWFEGLTISNLEGGDTVIYGPVADQAALHGVLMKIRDLGLCLVQVRLMSSHADGMNEPSER
jgi:hypothetical protein